MRNLTKIRTFRRLLDDNSGGSLVTLAIALSAVVGLGGLGAETASWYSTKRTMQGAADTAAFAAAVAKAAGATPTMFTSEARSIAGTFNFVDGTSGVGVSVNSPPSSGGYTSNGNAVEVVITQPQTALLSSVFLASGPTISTRSVALSNSTGNGCVLALDRGNVVDFVETGNTTLNLYGCSVYINSPNAAALTMSGNATMNANAAYVSGGVSTSGNAQVNTGGHTFTGVNPINDPYANVPIPSYSGCDQTNYSLSGGAVRTLSASGAPYVFCNGLSLSGGSSLTLTAGVYLIDRGSFSVSGGSTVTATAGVTIVLTSSTGNSYATISLSGGSTLNITAPTSGTTAGIALYQDRNAPNTGTNSITGNSAQNITGAIYFPNQTVSYSGGSGTTSSGCTQLIAYKLSFSGNSNFGSSCNGIGVATIGASAGQIVE